MRVLVVGGGVTGAGVAFHRARAARTENREVEVVVVEPRERLGAGLAYSACDPTHRINVPARRMSLDTEDPDAFVRWLEQTGATGDDGTAQTHDGELFPQRSLFGRYVADALRPLENEGRVRHVRARAVEAARVGGGFAVQLSDGRAVTGDQLVLAVTHPLPSVPLPLQNLVWHPALHADPYDPQLPDSIGPQDRVLIVGTGLTMADTVAALDRSGHRGPILALSRHGWRSRGHAVEPAEPFGDFASAPETRVTALVRRVRAAVAAAAREGAPWQAVFDALRRQGPQIWAALSAAERARLLRHLRTLWDVHRFRIAPQVEAVLDRLEREGRLRILAASLGGGEAVGDVLRIALRPRHAQAAAIHETDHVVVTTGPAHGTVIRGNPLLASLAAAGEIGPDPLGLGIHTAPDGRAIGRDRAPSPHLFVAGPLARGTVGELMGLPEVALHAETIARRLVEDALQDSGNAAPAPPAIRHAARSRAS